MLFVQTAAVAICQFNPLKIFCICTLRISNLSATKAPFTKYNATLALVIRNKNVSSRGSKWNNVELRLRLNLRHTIILSRSRRHETNFFCTSMQRRTLTNVTTVSQVAGSTNLNVRNRSGSNKKRSGFDTF